MLHRVLLILTMLLMWAPVARAETPGEGGDRAYKKQSKEEQEAEISEAEKEAERKRKEKLARIIVLKWPGTEADYEDETIQRNVRSRIARPDAMFFPDVDLYQSGRKVKDRTVIAANQPARVPDSVGPEIMRVVEEVAAIPYERISLEEWGLRAQELREMVEKIWFVDRVELREPMFLLYAQIGRAAYNYDQGIPPFFDSIGGFNVNYYWYLAATLAYQEPGLMSKLTDQELASSVGYYLQQLQSGTFPTIKVDFEQENQFEEDFFEKYEILLNGLPVELDENAQFDVFLGRTDIYLRRLDSGHGLSERLEVAKLEDRIYFVRDVARKRMGVDFIEQLFLYKNECVPDVDGDILDYLAIYAKLHDKAEIYIAVPENGNPNRVYIWRYDKRSAQLSLVGGGGDNFPVRFAFLFSSGVLYNGATVAFTEPSGEDVANQTPQNPLTPDVDVDLTPAFIPLNLQLRGHYNRLMLNVGAEFGYAVTDADDVGSNETGKALSERYPVRPLKDHPDATVVECNNQGVCTEVFNNRDFNRHLYLGAGVLLGRDAGIGFGPRLAAQFGWTNLPHAFQTTAHFGWAIQPPIPPAAGERVRPLIDIDLRGGAAITRPDSLHRDLVEASKQDNNRNNDESIAMPVFGLTAGIGLTF